MVTRNALCLAIKIIPAEVIKLKCLLLHVGTLADPRGGVRDAPPPGSKFFHFHAVFGKKLKNNSTFGSWRPPPGENPGSATAVVIYLEWSEVVMKMNFLLRPIYMKTSTTATTFLTHCIATTMAIEFFRIEFYRIYRIYRICRKLFLVVLTIQFLDFIMIH